MPTSDIALYDLLQTIRPLHRRVARSVASHLEGAGIGVGARAVLACLAEGGPATVPQAGRALFLPRQNVQKWMDELLAAGLVAKHPNPAHRRSPVVALTDKGTAFFERIRAREQAFLAPLASDLDAGDVEAAARVLSACLAHFAAYEDDPDRPGPIG